MKILVTGATGAVGPRVVGALCEGGYSVRTFSIDDLPSASWPFGVEVLKGDITDPGIYDFTHFRSNFTRLDSGLFPSLQIGRATFE